MKWDASTQLSAAAIAISVVALLISLFSSFPGLKGLISVVRDGVLWLAMLVVLGGVGFVVYQRLQQSPAVSQGPRLEALPVRQPAPPFIPEPRQP